MSLKGNGHEPNSGIRSCRGRSRSSGRRRGSRSRRRWGRSRRRWRWGRSGGSRGGRRWLWSRSGGCWSGRCRFWGCRRRLRSLDWLHLFLGRSFGGFRAGLLGTAGHEASQSAKDQKSGKFHGGYPSKERRTSKGEIVSFAAKTSPFSRANSKIGCECAFFWAASGTGNRLSHRNAEAVEAWIPSSGRGGCSRRFGICPGGLVVVRCPAASRWARTWPPGGELGFGFAGSGVDDADPATEGIVAEAGFDSQLGVAISDWGTRGIPQTTASVFQSLGGCLQANVEDQVWRSPPILWAPLRKTNRSGSGGSTLYGRVSARWPSSPGTASGGPTSDLRREEIAPRCRVGHRQNARKSLERLLPRSRSK